MIRSTYLENDEFGYSCYVLVIPAPERFAPALLDIEKTAGQELSKIPSHVTVKGTFYAIESLDGVLDAIRQVAARHAPFSLSFVGREFVGLDHSVILGFPGNPQIQALHDDLMANIAPLGKPAYPDDPYRVHMSIVNEVGSPGVEIARKELEKIDLGDEMQIDAFDLWARDGVAWGGTWKRLERFELGGSG